MRSIGFLLALVLVAGCGSGKPNRPKPTPPPPSSTTLELGTYLGNDLADLVRDIALDSSGNLYAVGGARSADLLPGAPVLAFAGEEDAFVAKLDPTGAVLWWTFLGGPGPDRAHAVDLDGQGNVVVGGGAADAFPVTPGAVLTQFQGGTSTATDPARDGFVAKLDGATGALLWATYFGGTDAQTSVVRDLAADPVTNVIYLLSSVQSPATPPPPPGETTPDYLPDNFPPVILAALQNGHLALRPGDQAALSTDGVLAKLTPDGAQLPWATYVGGASNETAEGSVRLDSLGQPVVLMGTTSVSRVTTPAVIARVVPDPDIAAVPAVFGPMTTTGAFDAFNDGALDFFVAKYATDGSQLWATFVGTTGGEIVESNNLAIRSDGRILIAGGTTSSDFPISATAFDPNFNGSGGAFPFAGDCAIFVLEADGSARVASTYYGGSSGDGCSGVGSDSSGNVYVAGGTRSADIPTGSGAHQTQQPAPLSAFIAVFSADLAKLRYGSYFSGTGGGNANALVVRGSAHFSFGGEAGAGYPLPTTPPPARSVVSDSALHGAVSDVTVQLGPG